MDRLWTPWRSRYLAGQATETRKGVPAELASWPEEQDTKCVFCNLLASADYAVRSGMPRDDADRAARILLRGTHTFTCLNAFPYSSGHVLIIPYRHCASLSALETAAAEEMIRTAQLLEAVLRTTYRPDGLNLGMNLGQAAGAGVAEHLHLHALPRWAGDSNFISVIGETRILPETLDTTWVRLHQALNNQKTSLVPVDACPEPPSV